MNPFLDTSFPIPTFEDRLHQSPPSDTANQSSMEDCDEVCNTKLALGIGSANSSPKSIDKEDHQNPINDPLSLNLSFGFGASSFRAAGESSNYYSSSNEEEGDRHNRNGNNDGGSRKKLRLSKEQSFVLEENFKEHTTLNTAQKNNLATLLNLNSRQVEVWFQNRRARTKLKLTETDCERWKKNCEELTEENKRLKKELCELQALKKFQERAMALRLAHQATNAGPDLICPNCCRCWKIESERGNPAGEPPAASSLNRVAVDDKTVVLKA